MTVSEVRVRDDIERALQSADSQGAGGLLALSSPFIGANTKLLADLALKYRLPAVTLFTDFARDGGLMAYGPNLQTVLRQEGVIAAKILLASQRLPKQPIETPTKFEFVFESKNGETRLALSIPASTLLRADEVIE